MRRDEPPWDLFYINPAGARLFGVEDSRDMIGRPLLDFIHPQHQSTLSDEFAKIREEGKSLHTYNGQLFRIDEQVVDFLHYL